MPLLIELTASAQSASSDRGDPEERSNRRDRFSPVRAIQWFDAEAANNQTGDRSATMQRSPSRPAGAGPFMIISHFQIKFAAIVKSPLRPHFRFSNSKTGSPNPSVGNPGDYP
jgi:hypothetical protein